MESFHCATHQNLRLLTKIFPNLDMEPKLQKGMFKRPNTKGMQSVFYSLLIILNPEYCQEHVPWPVSFTTDNYKFRVAIINFIEKECKDFEPPKLLPSLLNKADGEKYVRFLFNFVTYVTKMVLNRRYERTLTKPSLTTAYDESLSLLNDVTTCVYRKNEESKERYQTIMENSSKLKNILDHEMMKKLEAFRIKKEELHHEVKDVLSYTNINEDNLIERAISDYEDELREFQRNYYIIRDDVNRILRKKEKLLQLIYLKHTTRRDLVDVNYLKSAFSEEFAKTIATPLQVIKSSLFVNSDCSSQICLKSFLHFGHLLLKSRMRRFLKSEMSERHVTICQTANDIFSNTSKRFDDLMLLDSKLDLLISRSQKAIPDLKSQYHEVFNVNDNFLKLMHLLKSFNKCHPQPFVSIPERPLLLEFPSVTKSIEDPVARMKKMKALMAAK